MPKDMSHNRNPAGKNGIIARKNTLPANYKDILQEMQNRQLKQKEMLEELEQQGLGTNLRQLQTDIKEYGVMTSRKNHLTADEVEAAIHTVTLDDPLGRWGYRRVKHKLQLKGIPIPRDMVAQVHAEANPNAAAMRGLTTRKVHRRGLISAGSNEEWGGDAHLKLWEDLRLALYCFLDKCSRRILHHAVVGRLTADIPLIVYLETLQKVKKMPLRLTTDMGSETGEVARLQQVLRAELTELQEEVIPSHVFVKSVYNITVERGWRPMYETELANFLAFFRQSRPLTFQSQNPTQVLLSRWVWARILESRMAAWVYEKNTSVIRKQKKVLLPTGFSPDKIYFTPGAKGIDLKDMGIALSDETLAKVADEVKKKYPNGYSVFTPQQDEWAHGLYDELCHLQPDTQLSMQTGWTVFEQMLLLHSQRVNVPAPL